MSEHLHAATGDSEFLLRLYVAGQTPRSLRAVANMRRICAEELQGHYQLEVIDLYQQPQLAEGEQIVAVPALIKRLPSPLRMVIGDMSDTERVLVGLDLLPRA
jgi:circadian clock protein KaiB